MASLPVLLFATLVVLGSANSLATVEGVKEFKVGGREGWREPDENSTSMYNDWATRLRFHVGDSLCKHGYHSFQAFVCVGQTWWCQSMRIIHFNLLGMLMHKAIEEGNEYKYGISVDRPLAN